MDKKIIGSNGRRIFYTNVYTDVELHERVNFTSSKFEIFANPNRRPSNFSRSGYAYQISEIMA